MCRSKEYVILGAKQIEGRVCALCADVSGNTTIWHRGAFDCTGIYRLELAETHSYDAAGDRMMFKIRAAWPPDASDWATSSATGSHLFSLAPSMQRLSTPPLTVNALRGLVPGVL